MKRSRIVGLIAVRSEVRERAQTLGIIALEELKGYFLRGPNGILTIKNLRQFEQRGHKAASAECDRLGRSFVRESSALEIPRLLHWERFCTRDGCTPVRRRLDVRR